MQILYILNQNRNGCYVSARHLATFQQQRHINIMHCTWTHAQLQELLAHVTHHINMNIRCMVLKYGMGYIPSDWEVSCFCESTYTHWIHLIPLFYYCISICDNVLGDVLDSTFESKISWLNQLVLCYVLLCKRHYK
jgi:hypothetical protein